MGGDGGKRKGHDGEGGGGKGKRTKYYQSATNSAIPQGTTGIFITCDNGREDRTAEEMSILIEEHYDKLVGKSQAAQGSTGGDGGDIAAAIAAEVKQLKDKKKRRFGVVNANLRGCVYIQFPKGEDGGPSPVEVVQAVCEEAVSTLTLRCRFVNRILPITHVVHASVDEMKEAAAKVLPPLFPKETDKGLDFAVDYEHRNSDKFDRLAVINAFVDSVPTPPHKVNLTKPDRTILVQLTKNTCAFSVVPRYRELHKFNLRKCAGVLDDQPGPPKKQATVAAAKPTPAPATAAEKAENVAPPEENPASEAKPVEETATA